MTVNGNAISQAQKNVLLMAYFFLDVYIIKFESIKAKDVSLMRIPFIQGCRKQNKCSK